MFLTLSGVVVSFPSLDLLQTTRCSILERKGLVSPIYCSILVSVRLVMSVHHVLT